MSKKEQQSAATDDGSAAKDKAATSGSTADDSPTVTTVKDTATLFPVEELAENKKLKPWYLAGLRQATSWAVGKQVTEAEFETAVQQFNDRRQGGGKL